jgi:hypothetical protein
VRTEDTNRHYSVNIVIFIFSVFIISILTGISWFLAFANDEQGPSLVGAIGHYMFLVFRFPTHNIIWLRPELINSWFVPGLAINVFLYSMLTTVIVAKLRINRQQND